MERQSKSVKGFSNCFFNHLNESDRIIILRCLNKAPNWKYELIEIPKELLQKAKNGLLEMKMDSKQMPKPGYCTVSDEFGEIEFQLYFDGGSERKLQIKNLRKNLCKVIGEWNFDPNPLGDK